MGLHQVVCGEAWDTGGGQRLDRRSGGMAGIGRERIRAGTLARINEIEVDVAPFAIAFGDVGDLHRVRAPSLDGGDAAVLTGEIRHVRDEIDVPVTRRLVAVADGPRDRVQGT